MPFHMLEPLHDYRRPHQGIQDHSPTLLPEMFIHKRFTSSRLASHRRSTSKMKNTEKAREPPEDLRVELLRRPPRIPEPKTTRFFWRYCGGPSRRRRSRPEFVVCLQVHEIRGLPPALNGRAVAVGWRTKGCRGETTLPVTVRGGEARFEEIFLHHCRGDAGDAVKGFYIWVSVIGAEECDLGRFDVDVAGMVPVDRMAAKFGGKVKRFELCGQGKGGELSVSIHCRMVGVELSGPVRRRSGEWLRAENKVYASVESEQRQDDHQSGSNCKCLPRLRKPKRRKNRKPMSPQHRKNSPRFLPSEKHGFVTTDSSTQGERRSGGAASSAGEGNSGFITMEKGAVCPPPSSSSFDGDDVDGTAAPFYNCSEEDEENEWEIEDEDGEDTDLERVEEEFLQMLEDEKAISAYGFSWDGPDAELKSLIKMAEAEVTDAVQARKGRSSAGGAALEREEYEDLLKNWGSSMRRIADNSSSYSTFSSSSTRHDGSGFRLAPFGSPL